ncbi:MAG: hypothetical protein ACRC8A_14265 [Microcoleaceae cyanobacterium]
MGLEEVKPSKGKCSRSKPLKTASSKQVALLFLYLLPIAGVIWFITYFGVDVPIADQWVLPELLEKAATQKLTWGDLFELHNTHRILFPRLIFIGLGLLSSWNIKIELYFSLGLVILTALILYQLAVNTSIIKRGWLFHGTNLLTCILIFSLYQSWLWGFQLPIFWINSCVILACFILTAPSFNPQVNHTKFRLSGAGICCFIVSFSSAQGLISWLATVPCVVSLMHRNLEAKLTSQKYLKTICQPLTIWLLLLILSCRIYALGYIQEPEPKSNLSLIEYLATATQFLLNLLAAPLTNSLSGGWVLGLITLLNFLGLMFYFSWGMLTPTQPPTVLNHQTFDRSAPWISIGLFSFLTSGLMTLGRVDLGGSYPLYAVRYTTHTVLLLIAIIQLWRVLIEQKQCELPPEVTQNFNLLYSFFAGILVCLIGVRTEEAIASTQADFFYVKSGQTCLEVLNYLEDSVFFNQSPERCLLRMSKSTWWIQEGVKSLQTVGLRNFLQDADFITHSPQTHGYIDFPVATSKPFQLQDQDSIQLSGWAVFPGQKQQPQLVFLSTKALNSYSFFANAYVVQESPDIAEFFKSNRYSKSRWSVTFSANNLAQGEQVIQAWIYDSIQQQFLRLDGEVKVEIS